MIVRVLTVLALTLLLNVSSAASENAATAPDKGRVLVAEHSGATRAFVPQDDVVAELVREGLTRFASTNSVRAAWLSLVSTQDTIGLKVFSSPGPASGTRKSVVSALIDSLIEAGIAREKIIIWDKRLIDLRLAGYYELAQKHGVRVAGSIDSGFDPAVSYPNQLLGRLVYGDLEFGRRGEGIGRNSYVTTLLTHEITKVINVTPLLNHNVAGVSGSLFSMAVGSVDNVLRFEEPDRLANAVPEIYALPEVGDRVALNIVDALICQYRGEERTLLHYSTPLNQLWFSRDPLALDMLALAELDRQNKERKLPKSTLQIYENAALLELGVGDPKRIRIEKLVIK